MTQYQVTVNEQTLQRLFSGDSQLALLLESVLNQVLDAQVSEQLHAERCERTDERQEYRNGYKPHYLTTRVGTLTLRVPQVREGGFSSELFARYQSRYIPGQQLYLQTVHPRERADAIVYNEDPVHPRLKFRRPVSQP